MSDEKTGLFTLEEGIGRVQDDAGTLFNRTAGQDNDTVCTTGCAALDAVRDCVADQPVIAVSVAGVFGIFLGALIARKA